MGRWKATQIWTKLFKLSSTKCFLFRLHWSWTGISWILWSRGLKYLNAIRRWSSRKFREGWAGKQFRLKLNLWGENPILQSVRKIRFPSLDCISRGSPKSYDPHVNRQEWEDCHEKYFLCNQVAIWPLILFWCPQILAGILPMIGQKSKL